MGQIPNKTYTAPDGSVYRVEADGSVTKIKGGRVQSNEPLSKYQISSDGKIYRVESDGSVTYLGNAEDIQNPPHYTTSYNTKRSVRKWGRVIAIAILVVTVAISYMAYQLHHIVTPIDAITSSDSIALTNGPIEIQSLDYIDTIPLRQLSQKVVEPINQEVNPNEEINEEKPQTVHTDMPNTRHENYYIETPCGQMEGPDNFFVLFPDGKTYLCSAHIKRIDEMLTNLHSYTDYKIVIDGYRSSFTGTHNSNMEDARLRVNSIVNDLKSKGIPDDRIITEVHDIHVDYFGPYGHVSVMVE